MKVNSNPLEVVTVIRPIVRSIMVISYVKDIIGKALIYISSNKELDNKNQVITLIDDVCKIINCNIRRSISYIYIILYIDSFSEYVHKLLNVTRLAQIPDIRWSSMLKSTSPRWRHRIHFVCPYVRLSIVSRKFQI